MVNTSSNEDKETTVEISVEAFEQIRSSVLDAIIASNDIHQYRMVETKDATQDQINAIVETYTSYVNTHKDRITGIIDDSVEDEDKSWELWIEELENVVGGISTPSLSQLLGSLGNVSSAVLAPVLVAFEAVSATIATIKEFISNLASDIATGMETALATIGTIVIDPLLGILSAFGDYLGEKISGFIENAIGEK